MASVAVRQFQEADRSAVLTLWDEAFPHEPAHNKSAPMIDLKLRVQPELFLVATLDGAVVGCVMAGFDGVRGWLHRLAVRGDARRKGVGRRLVETAETALVALGCPKVNLQVRDSNKDVIAFYRQLGYLVEDHVSMGRIVYPLPSPTCTASRRTSIVRPGRPIS